jgi:hypothetical protein
MYYAGGADDCGRTLKEVLTWDSSRLERTHDYIQWLFPLREPSDANPDAPVLSRTDVDAFRHDPHLQAQMIRALHVMLRFYGLELRDDEVPIIDRGQGFDSRAAAWVTRGNHNFLRLTRILRSLRTVGLDAYAQALFKALAEVHRDQAAVVGSITFEYWQNAITDPCLV